MKKYFTIILIAFISLTNFAQSYEGVIGKHSIFMELDTDYEDNGVQGFYFYKSQLKNINLEGSKENNQIIVHLKHKDKDDKIELFTLKVIKNKLIGTWQHNSKKLPVELTQTKKNYLTYKRGKFDFIKKNTSKYNDKEIIWFTEKYSKQSLFRLGNGFTKAERNFLNPKLDSIHFRHAETYLECDVVDLNIQAKLVSDKYISISETYSIDCGGAHPNYGIVAYNFDLKKGMQLKKIKDVFPNLDYYSLLKNKYQNDSELQKECDYFSENSEEAWQYCTWFLTKKGLTVIPQYPHAMTPCEEGFTLTYKELKQ